MHELGLGIFFIGIVTAYFEKYDFEFEVNIIALRKKNIMEDHVNTVWTLKNDTCTCLILVQLGTWTR